VNDKKKSMEVLSYIPQDNVKPSTMDRIRKRELVRAYHLVDLNRGDTIVDVRVYIGRSASASTVYAAVWIHSDLVVASINPGAVHTMAKQGSWGVGTGSAGGYGYDKRSSAIAEALSNAGVKLSMDIGGRGDSMVIEALKAIGAALGAGNTVVVESFA